MEPAALVMRPYAVPGGQRQYTSRSECRYALVHAAASSRSESPPAQLRPNRTTWPTGARSKFGSGPRALFSESEKPLGRRCDQFTVSLSLRVLEVHKVVARFDVVVGSDGSGRFTCGIVSADSIASLTAHRELTLWT